MLKNNRGITLVSLVITILVLIITGSIATYSGISAVKYINFANAKAQMETMQSKVNGWYQESKENPDILNYGEPLNGIDTEKVSSTLGMVSKNDYKYFSSDYIKNTLNIDGISYDFLINIKQASVFLYGGITYEGTKYCSAKDFGINQVESEEISGKIDFDTTIKDNNIIVHNIKIKDNNNKDLDISKYEVQYKFDQTGYWDTLTSDMKKRFENDNNAWYIPIKGTCKIKITTSGIQSDEHSVTIADMKENKIIFNENATLADEFGDTIIVPKKFTLSSESPTRITEGMIIEDSEENQYVWIPIFKKTESREWGVDYSNVSAKEDYINIESALKKYGKSYIFFSDNSDEWYGDDKHGGVGYYEKSDTEKTNLKYYTNGNMTEEGYNNLYQNMLISLYKNGGFYIGRYEMGIDVVTNSTDAQRIARTNLSLEYNITSNKSTNEPPTVEGMKSPISKANAIPYNYITQSQAQMLAEKLGEKDDYINVVNSILFGIQKKAVCAFIDKCDNNELRTSKTSVWLTNSTYGKLWGNYRGSSFLMDRGFYSESGSSDWKDKPIVKKEATEIWLCTTGASDQNSSLNIYDFGGNLSEFTLEKSTHSTPNLATIESGTNAWMDGYMVPTYSTWIGIGTAKSSTSARVALYINNMK